MRAVCISGLLAAASFAMAAEPERLIGWAAAAIDRHGLPRTLIQAPERPGQGRWIGMGAAALERDLPGYGFTADMTAYWSTAPGLESFDAGHFQAQLRVLAELVKRLMH